LKVERRGIYCDDNGGSRQRGAQGSGAVWRRGSVDDRRVAASTAELTRTMRIFTLKME
jgi:hypothetical protein